MYLLVCKFWGKYEKCVAMRHANPFIHDFYRNFLAGALRHGLHDGADLLGDPTLAANDLAHVAFGNTKLEDGAFVVLNFGDGDCLRIVHQILCHIRQKFFHCASP